MTIPASHIAVFAFMYALEYVYRAWKDPTRRFMNIGKAVGRFMLAAVYFLFVFRPDMLASSRAPLVRLSLLIFFAIDLLFLAQEHLEELYLRKNHVNR